MMWQLHSSRNLYHPQIPKERSGFASPCFYRKGLFFTAKQAEANGGLSLAEKRLVRTMGRANEDEKAAGVRLAAIREVG